MNTKYFQTLANSHRRYNAIEKLKIDNEIIDDKVLISEKILKYYQNLYNESEEWRPTSSFEGVAWLTEVDKEMLERAFEEDEVHATIQACSPDKAPGPDGFTMAFF